MNIYITMGGKAYDTTIAKAVNNAPRFGANKVVIYDDKWLFDHPFVKINKWLFDHPGHKNPDGSWVKVGQGWYSWKPLILLDAYHKANDGDIIMYVDGDSYPIADMTPLYQIAQQEDRMIFEENGCIDRHWVKEDIYTCIGLTNINRDHPHSTARWILFKKGNYENLQFLQEWQTYLINRRCNTREPSIIQPEHEKFVENRGDQSVFSLLTHKYGWKQYRACDAAGEASQNDRDKYGLLFKQEYCHKDRSDLSGSKYRNI